MKQHHILWFLLLIVGICAAFIADLCLGDVSIPFKQLFNSQGNSILQTIVTDFRLPKAITALCCGAALSLAGLLMQTMFQNPLAGPYILGISSGSTLGVALLILAVSWYPMPLWITSTLWGQVGAAFTGALLIMLLVMLTSIKVKDIGSLLIVGVMLGSLSASVVSVLQVFSNPETLKQFILWTMGSVQTVTWNQLQIMIPLLVAGMLLALFISKPLNAFLLGERYAQSMGVSMFIMRILTMIITCILAGVCTAFCGPIAFIGVAVPHIVRGILHTNNHFILIPGCLLTGGLLLLLCDLISMLPGTHYHLPINAVCAIVGAPVILTILIKNKHLAS